MASTYSFDGFAPGTPVTVYAVSAGVRTEATSGTSDSNGRLTAALSIGDYVASGKNVSGQVVESAGTTVHRDSDNDAAGGFLTQTDASGTFTPFELATGNQNRPRKRAIPSFQNFTRLAQVMKGDAVWKGQYVGIGFDIFWDSRKQQHALLFCGSDSGTGTTRFGVAWSDDLLTWSEYGSNPVFGPNATGGQPDSGAVTYPQVYVEDGTIYLYYIGFPTAGYEIGTPSICYATAPVGADLTNSAVWTRHGAVVTTASFPGAAAVTVLYRPNVMKHRGTYYLFCNAGPAIGDEDIWCFTAPAVTGPWTRVQDTPVLSGGLYGDTKFADPEVIQFGDQFVMLSWVDAGLCMAYCDESEFPTTWHTPAAILPGMGGAQRPLWVEGPSGPLLYVNYAGSQSIDVFRPAGWGNYAPPKFTPLTGRYMRTPGVVLTAPTGMGDGYMTLSPLLIEKATYLTSLSVNVTTSAAGSIRLGLYRDDGNGVPLLLDNGVDFGTVSAGSTGVKTKSGLNVSLSPGLYWMAAVSQGGAPNVTGLSNVAHDAFTSATLADLFANFYGWYTTAGGVSGAMPASLSGLIAPATNPIPLVVAGF